VNEPPATDRNSSRRRATGVEAERHARQVELDGRQPQGTGPDNAVVAVVRAFARHQKDLKVTPARAADLDRPCEEPPQRQTARDVVRGHFRVDAPVPVRRRRPLIDGQQIRARVHQEPQPDPVDRDFGDEIGRLPIESRARAPAAITAEHQPPRGVVDRESGAPDEVGTGDHVVPARVGSCREGCRQRFEGFLPGVSEPDVREHDLPGCHPSSESENRRVRAGETEPVGQPHREHGPRSAGVDEEPQISNGSDRPACDDSEVSTELDRHDGRSRLANRGSTGSRREQDSETDRHDDSTGEGHPHGRHARRAGFAAQWQRADMCQTCA
jgi:hypothetical protein